MRVVMKTYLLLSVLILVSFSFVNNIFAEEDCTTMSDAYLARSRDALNEFHQYKSDNNQEEIDKLIKERIIFQIPQELGVVVKEKQPEGFYNLLIPAFQFNGWALKEDIICIKLIDIPNFDYFPLEIGNMWEYKSVSYRTNEKHERTVQKKIEEKVINEDGSVTFYSNNKPYIYKYNDSIVAENGIILMKLPLVHGARWQSKGSRSMDKILFLKDAGFRFDLNGTSYMNCIRIVSKTDYHALSKGDSVQYTAFESQSVYAPDVGLLQTDVYEILKDNGKRTHIYNKKLVSFKTNQPVSHAEKRKPAEGNFVRRVNSFRFPETQFIHPYLSPNEKWLIYFKSNTIWEELYYTETNKAEKNILPVFPQNADQKKERNTIGGRKWSPDGNTLAVEIELGYDEHISLIDFSTGTPELIELAMTNIFH